MSVSRVYPVNFKIEKVCSVFIIVGTILRFLFPWIYNPLDFLASDPMRHWHNGELVFSGSGESLMTYYDPLPFQVFMGVVQKLLVIGVGVVPFVFSLLCAIMPWFFYRASREMGFDRQESAWIWCAIIWTPSLWVIYQFVMMETLLLVGVGFALWMVFRAIRNKKRGSFVVAVLAWVVAVMIKPLVIILAVCFCFYLLLKVPWKGSWLITASSISFLILLPNIIRTYHGTGIIAPLGLSDMSEIYHQSGVEKMNVHWKKGKWNFASPSCYQKPLEPFSNWMMERTNQNTEILIQADPQHGSRDWRVAMKTYRNLYNDFWTRQKENWIMFFFSSSWPDNQYFKGTIPGRLNHQFRWMIALTLVFVLTGNLARFIANRWEILPVTTTLFILFLMFQPFVTFEGRYRKALEPLLVMNLVWNAGRNLENRSKDHGLLQSHKKNAL